MNEGEVLGQVFNLPEPLVAPVARAGTGAGAGPTMDDKYFGIPEAAEGLQTTGNVADQTAAYYQKLAGIRQFAQGMWKNYGIDVTKPDYSRPEAVAASQAFAMELANAQATANMGQRSQKMLEDSLARPNTVIPTSATQGGYYAALSPEQQSTFTGLDPASEAMQRNYSGDVENRGLHNEEMAQFEAKLGQMAIAASKTTDPAERNRLFDQIDRIRQAQNLKINPPSQNSFEINYGNKLRVGLEEITRIVNHQRGVFKDPKALAPSDYYSGDVYWMENKDFNGTDIGQIPVPDSKGNVKEVRATIAKTVVNPETGEVRWVFKEDVPPLRIDNLPTKTLIGYLGGRLNKTAIDEYLANHPHKLDTRSEIIQDEFINRDTKAAADTLKTQVGQVALAESGVAKNEIKKATSLRNAGFWSAIAPWNWGTSASKTYTTQDGKPVIVTRIDDDNFEIENISEVMPGEKPIVYKEYRNLTTDKLPSALKKLGVLPGAPIEAQQAPVTPTVPTSVPGTSTVKEYVTPTGAKYTHDQLIKMGYTEANIQQAITLGNLK